LILDFRFEKGEDGAGPPDSPGRPAPGGPAPGPVFPFLSFKSKIQNLKSKMEAEDYCFVSVSGFGFTWEVISAF
jgi:hypothetical protein